MGHYDITEGRVHERRPEAGGAGLDMARFIAKRLGLGLITLWLLA